MTLTMRRLVLSMLAATAGTTAAQAGWNSVAHLTCNDGPIRRAFRLNSDCDQPAPAPQRTVEYETRTYYEPQTVMKAETIQEPVDIKVRSYYWEPVQSYVRRSYYDPCSGQCNQIDVPRTSYVRKEECRTETRYLEKVRMVPVQVQREVTETRPVYTYYGPTTRKYGPTTSERAPRVDDIRNQPRFEMERGHSGGSSGTYSPIPGTSLPVVPGQMEKFQKTESKKPAPVENDNRFNSLSTSLTKLSGARLFGEVFTMDRETPASNAKIVFVNVADKDDRKYITTDAYGSFDANLPAGEWHVYGGPGTGKAELIGKLTTADGDRLEPKVALKTR